MLVSSLSYYGGQHRADRHGEVGLDRPGSKSGAEVWEGLSRNLVSVLTLFEVPLVTVFEVFPVPVPTRCREFGNGNRHDPAELVSNATFVPPRLRDDAVEDCFAREKVGHAT
jgi:hypothetical protein